ncbi:MAG TPA: 1-deoxy-D-xylulose-5-phosphate reductoisomerase [Candidatus Acidoferrum sp.]|nr:1-deoxy-D-xylulose-5-phosphate reductoisomerase [Candidatus Acidoferrum sp.]
MISILGSTGSIGRQTIEVAGELGVKIAGLAAGGSTDVIERQARACRPQLVAMADDTAAKDLKDRLFGTGIEVAAGCDGVCRVAALPEAGTVVSAIVGAAGILPTVAAIEAGKRIALANKETLVAAGAYVMPLARRMGVEILPVDSEHAAIFQCLLAAAGGEVSRILLTASGGPFFGMTRAQLSGVTKEQALKHPSWTMGAKITVDSATLMNKGFEVIEAMWLFGVPLDKIEVIIHRESIIHSMVEYADGTIMAQLGCPDMKTPIRLALTWPRRATSQSRLDFERLAGLSLAKPDTETFGCLALCRQAATRGGTAPAALNGANEAAVGAFLKGDLPYLGIEGVCRTVLEQTQSKEPTLDNILAADRAARELANEVICAWSQQ